MSGAVAMLRRWSRRVLILIARDATPDAGRRSVLVVAPHPDDETLGCGGRMLLSTALGTPVTIVVVSDGHAAWGRQDDNGAALAALRRDELLRAAERLGVPERDVVMLGYPDSELHDHVEDIAADLSRLIDERSPQDLLVTCDESAHPDHSACAVAAAQAIEQLDRPPKLLYYPIWHFSEWPVSRRHGLSGVVEFARHVLRRSVETVQIPNVLEMKQHALAAYHSQVGTLQAGAREERRENAPTSLPADLIRNALGPRELFFTCPTARQKPVGVAA